MGPGDPIGSLLDWAAPIAWLLLLFFALLGPPIFRGGVVARHNISHVRLPYDQVTKDQGQSPRGRRAQELGEWRLLHLFGLFVSAPIALLADGLPGAALVVLTALIGNGLLRVMTDGLDYVGHGIEIRVAESEGRANYREQEIARMLRDWQRQHMTAADVERALERWDALGRFALKWLIWRD